MENGVKRDSYKSYQKISNVKCIFIPVAKSLLQSTLCPPHPLISNICSEMKIAALAVASEGEGLQCRRRRHCVS